MSPKCPTLNAIRDLLLFQNAPAEAQHKEKDSKRVRDESASESEAPQKRRSGEKDPKQNPVVSGAQGKSLQLQTRGPLALKGQGHGSAMILQSLITMMFLWGGQWTSWISI
ncbi:hypothetical protein N7481_013056 [Penicillium waksmanii]|uniref:uncharacterized protein n=1 Tax=Penicillium waksmanii TaxID=69791 RepID=UPI0025475811|nr:uncharacterized protein N7481_013056 [Penicillium waksmanii]KAJ5966342.1 hypothetical protein N7481_013056 [Penicillium waksmanii]